jgi:hypothetical protein
MIYVKAYFTIVYLSIHDRSANIYTHIYEKQNFIGDKPTADYAEREEFKNSTYRIIKFVFTSFIIKKMCSRNP